MAGTSRSNRASPLRRTFAVSAALACLAGAAGGEGRDAPRYNTFGLPGLIEMPSAEALPDAELAVTLAILEDTRRATLTFQVAPRLTLAFRYSGIGGFNNPNAVPSNDPDGVFYDRSFDLRYQILTETGLRPAVAIGLQDFVGTGIYGGEYLVATKTLAPGLRVTGGLGWGRFAGRDAIGSTGTRPEVVLGRGGVPTYDRWFRGDVSPFGGISYAPNDKLTLRAEYAPDVFEFENRFGTFEQSSPWNFGVDYRFRSGVQLSLYHLYGEQIGAQVTFAANPKSFGVPGGIEKAPLPVAPRGPDSARDLGWTGDQTRTARAEAELRSFATDEGLTLEAVRLEPQRATVRLINDRFGAPAQAYGRLARAMTRVLPGSIEEFVIVPVVNGIPLSALTLRRSDLERHEHDAADVMLARASIVDAYARAPAPDPGIYPKFDWSFAPYLRTATFDPDEPLRGEVGVRLSGNVEIAPNLVLSGSVVKPLGGNIDEVTRVSGSNLPRVRTDAYRFNEEGDPAIARLQLAHYGRPAPDLYSRVTLGYFERMYAGASAELLWRPVKSPLALGAELNYVRRREFDQLFGLTDNTTIDPVTGIEREIPDFNGHLSAYYDFGRGYEGRLHVGRYLAGDLGATVALDRTFANGFSIGAYATFTDASAEDFGEGSFDKGITITLPLSAVLGKPTRVDRTVVLSPLTRDGGARLAVSGRLNSWVKEYHEPEVVRSWGRFWR